MTETLGGPLFRTRIEGMRTANQMPEGPNNPLNIKTELTPGHSLPPGDLSHSVLVGKTSSTPTP